MKHASYRKTNIMRRQTKFSPHGNLEKAISAPLYQTLDKVQKPNSPNCYVHSSQLFRTDYHHLFRWYISVVSSIVQTSMVIVDVEVHRVCIG